MSDQSRGVRAVRHALSTAGRYMATAEAELRLLAMGGAFGSKQRERSVRLLAEVEALRVRLESALSQTDFS